MALEFAGKNVLLVDGANDSYPRISFPDIVCRFHCARHDIKGDRPDGKRCWGQKGHLCQLCTAYPVNMPRPGVYHKLTYFSRYSNVYGIDMPSRTELVAHGRDEPEIAKEIGADLVIFQTLPDLISSVRQFNLSIEQFDCSVFTGEYVTGGVDDAYLLHLEQLRADNVKGKAQGGGLGALEGKGGGAVNGVPNGGAVEDSAREFQEESFAASGSTNGADDTIGLHNHWKVN